ncbi:unnamed protein product [Acanthoscelides obtectus]|uniref:Uncharacterized protein n=1 Tax=Acanthoscelides obtectus TaxID=200917 RepID=A0A9P0JNW5_ACAOB|nr:unnamed protein product [Acanthoscelides obtectus]CAK1642846.1 hypothetical protein AOBTE_LOCUS13241 [Acanthoscelides obtectus]
MSSKKNKKLTDAELQYFAENLDEISSPDELSTASGESSSEEDPFHNSGESDESYKPSSSSDEDIQNDNSDTEEEEGNITAENSGEQFEIPAMNGNVDLDYQSFSATPSTGRPSTPTSDTATSALLPTRTVNRKKKAASNNNETAEAMSKINKKLDLLQEDSHDRFGKHVAARLRSIHPDQLKFAMKLITDVLFEADILSLNRYSKIITEDQHPPQQSPRETRKPHFNQYAPPCVTNTEPNRQISSQGWRQGY